MIKGSSTDCNLCVRIFFLVQSWYLTCLAFSCVQTYQIVVELITEALTAQARETAFALRTEICLLLQVLHWQRLAIPEYISYNCNVE